MPTRTENDTVSSKRAFSGPSNRPVSRILSTVLTSVAIVAVAGCGGEPDLARVKGRVSYKGSPVTTGEIFFTPEEPGKRGSKGIIGSDGSYSLSTFDNGDGAYVGKHKVSVISQGPDKPVPPKMKDRMLPEDMQGTGDPLVPRKYFSPQSSGLSADVAAGTSNVIDFDLQD